MTLATTLPALAPRRKPGHKPIHASAADRQREVRTWTTARAPSPAPGQAA